MVQEVKFVHAKAAIVIGIVAAKHGCYSVRFEATLTAATITVLRLIARLIAR